MKFHSQIVSCLFFFASTFSYALDIRSVLNPHGREIFQVRFFDQTEDTLGKDPIYQTPLYASRNLSEAEKKNTLSALSYWAEVIRPITDNPPAILNIGGDSGYGGTGIFLDFSKDNGVGSLQAALQGSFNGPPPKNSPFFGGHAMLLLGNFTADIAYAPAQLPRSSDGELFSLVVHEMVHALGIARLITTDNIDGFNFSSVLNSWEQHLRDNKGNRGTPQQSINFQGDPDNPAGFDLRNAPAYFKGKHVDEVLAESLLGVPVDSGMDIGHTDLKNSLISHQLYRNYTILMEAELAIFQDLGYTIDRRNFFGYSIYADGQTMINDRGFSRRDSNGKAYLPMQYNPTTLGMGLHIYGNHNTISQAGHLLSNGIGGAGARVDGSNNTLIILPHTRIYADGINGLGVMFAYGKNHTLIHQGDIQALGINGKAISFDFGSNLIGNTNNYGYGYLGSYIQTFLPKENADRLLTDLNGPLVKQVDITGRIAGQSAAIYIADNALVKQINIMRGAQLQGDIVSFYNQRNPENKLRLTQLTFGQRPTEQGISTGQSDPHFSLDYRGNIQGMTNLALVAQSGYLALNGQHQLYTLHISPTATLAGNSRYTLNQEGEFFNAGRLSPGHFSIGQINITGNYRQSTVGNLLIKTNGQAYDTLTVHGQAFLDGQLILTPQRDWYRNEWHADVLQADAIHGSLSVHSTISSPTLDFIGIPSANRYQLKIARRIHPYSQYASNQNDLQVGRVLDHLTTVATLDLPSLYRALDFSKRDGSEIRFALSQLSAATYSALFATALQREHQVSDLINGQLFTSRRLSPKDSTDLHTQQAFAIPFGGRFQQALHNDHVSYKTSHFGVIFGQHSQKQDGWQWGFHGVASNQTMNTTSLPAQGDTSSFSLGIHGCYASDPTKGIYLFGHGRIGIETGKWQRDINIADYSSRQQARWIGWQHSFLVGGGYQWALSDAIHLGPIATLNYTSLFHPEITESGQAATRLKLSSNRLHSLQSSIGIRSDFVLNNTLQALFQLSWKQALLSDRLIQEAHFAAYQNTTFSNTNTITPHRTLHFQLGLTQQWHKNITLQVHGATHLFHSDYKDFPGAYLYYGDSKNSQSSHMRTSDQIC